MYAVVNIILIHAPALHKERGGRFAFQMAHSVSRIVGKKKVRGNTLEAHHDLKRKQRRGPAVMVRELAGECRESPL